MSASSVRNPETDLAVVEKEPPASSRASTSVTDPGGYADLESAVLDPAGAEAIRASVGGEWIVDPADLCAIARPVIDTPRGVAAARADREQPEADPLTGQLDLLDVDMSPTRRGSDAR